MNFGDALMALNAGKSVRRQALGVGGRELTMAELKRRFDVPIAWVLATDWEVAE